MYLNIIDLVLPKEDISGLTLTWDVFKCIIN